MGGCTTARHKKEWLVEYSAGIGTEVLSSEEVIDIFFVLCNWRTVQYEKENGELSETVVNDCDKCIFFGKTMSRGKKNNHIFPNSCLTYLIKKYDEERRSMGKGKILFNIIWTDNCTGQYKCRQNFLQVALSCNTRDTMLLHKFAQKYGFKGSWDATGKLVKQAIERLELQNDRIATAYDCFVKLGKELTKDGTEADTTRLLEYKKTGNKKVTDNIPLTTRRTLIGFCMEDRQQFEQL
eukprot:7464440-Ditylum_brightwellii.AAC.1